MRGAYTEEVCRKRPSSLQTKIDVGGIDQSTAAETHKDGTSCDNPVTFLGEIVEGTERVIDKAWSLKLLLVTLFDLELVLLTNAIMIVVSRTFSVEDVLLFRQRRTVRGVSSVSSDKLTRNIHFRVNVPHWREAVIGSLVGIHGDDTAVRSLFSHKRMDGIDNANSIAQGGSHVVEGQSAI